MRSKRRNEGVSAEEWRVGQKLTLEDLQSGLPPEVFANVARVIEAARRKKGELLDPKSAFDVPPKMC